jgi:hypothetical protein
VDYGEAEKQLRMSFKRSQRRTIDVTKQYLQMAQLPLKNIG